MNLPNKITISRIILAILLIVGLLLPWHDLGVNIPEYVVNGETIDLLHIIAGFVFIIACLTDFLDGYLARSKNMVTDFGKMTDAIADKILVNGVLIVLTYERMVPVALVVVIIIRDFIVDSCKMICGNKGHVVAASYAGKAKTVCIMLGIILSLFNNYPFTYLGLPVHQLLLLLGALLSVGSGCEYYFETKDMLLAEELMKDFKSLKR